MRRQSGFTMLEVLVTIAVVSFGLLGVAGIIANGLKSNSSSYVRSQASWLANDIIDRMRANRGAAELSILPYNLAINATPTGATVAASDLISWRSDLANALPSGTGAVSIATATKKVTVTVQWDDSRASGGVSTQQFVVETRL